MIRMSWSKYNFYNMAHKPMIKESSNLRKSVFKQRWVAKREIRGYHVPNIPERQLLDRHFRGTVKLQHLSKSEREKTPPIQALGFGELERRVDVIVFRCHFAADIWKAREMVSKGYVTVNGKASPFPGRRLEDGDMISVNPKVVCTLNVTKEGPYQFIPYRYMRPWMFIPAYLEVNYPTCSAVLLRSPLPQPNIVEIPSPHPPEMHKLAFEWYAKLRRARTRIRIIKPLVVNGKRVSLKRKFDRMVRWDQKVMKLKKEGKEVKFNRVKVVYNPRRRKVTLKLKKAKVTK